MFFLSIASTFTVDILKHTLYKLGENEKQRESCTLSYIAVQFILCTLKHYHRPSHPLHGFFLAKSWLYICLNCVTTFMHIRLKKLSKCLKTW